MTNQTLERSIGISIKIEKNIQKTYMHAACQENLIITVE